MMNPASRNNNSQVTYICITSPLGKAKRNFIFPQREATATVLVFSGYLAISYLLYHIIIF